MDPADLREHLAAEPAYYRQAAAGFEQFAANKDSGVYGDSPQVKSMRVTIEAGIKLYAALADWSDWAQTVPPADPQDRGRARSSRACCPCPHALSAS